jgi:hypothetical protein
MLILTMLLIGSDYNLMNINNVKTEEMLFGRTDWELKAFFSYRLLDVHINNNLNGLLAQPIYLFKGIISFESYETIETIGYLYVAAMLSNCYFYYTRIRMPKLAQ